MRGHIERTQSGVRSRNIFENLNLLETMGPARRRVDTGEVEGSRPEDGGEGSERRRGSLFSGLLEVDLDER